MLNQAVHLAPGLTTVVGVIEKLTEPGTPRSYWDGTAKSWTTPAAPTLPPHVPVVPDPDIPGIYRLLIASADTALWPDGVYRATLLNTGIADPDQVAKEPWEFLMMAGDDGGLGYPSLSVTIPWLGDQVTVWGARRTISRKG